MIISSFEFHFIVFSSSGYAITGGGGGRVGENNKKLVERNKTNETLFFSFLFLQSTLLTYSAEVSFSLNMQMDEFIYRTSRWWWC